MKKMKFLLSITLVLALSLTYTSCKETSKSEAAAAEVAETEAPVKEVTPAELLTGKWTLKDMEFKSKEDLKDMKSFFDAMKEGLVGKFYYEFSADKTWINSSPPLVGEGDKIQKGNWVLSTDNKTIITSTEDGEKKVFEIISLDEKNLIFSISDDMGSQIITFTKG